MPLLMSTAEFVARAIAKHGDRYDYSEVDYKGYAAKVRIYCKKHSVWFEQLAGNHACAGSQGCVQCWKEKSSAKRTKSTEQFIADARAIHGDRFDYSQTEYVGAQKKLTVVCRDHGAFTQLATNHLAGYGCAECAATKQIFHEKHIPEEEWDDPAWIYVLLIEVGGERFSKIGYTSVFDGRMSRYKSEGVSVLKSIKFPATKYVGFEIERVAHKTLGEHRTRPKARFGGMTECYPPQYYDDLVGYVDSQTG